MDMTLEKQQVERTPLSVRLTEDEWQALDSLQELLGFSTRSQVVKRLIKTAYLKPANVHFIQPKGEGN